MPAIIYRSEKVKTLYNESKRRKEDPLVERSQCGKGSAQGKGYIRRESLNLRSSHPCLFGPIR
jgi:hypothetical protein